MKIFEIVIHKPDIEICLNENVFLIVRTYYLTMINRLKILKLQDVDQMKYPYFFTFVIRKSLLHPNYNIKDTSKVNCDHKQRTTLTV